METASVRLFKFELAAASDIRSRPSVPFDFAQGSACLPLMPPANYRPSLANYSIFIDDTFFILYYCIINSNKEF